MLLNLEAIEKAENLISKFLGLMGRKGFGQSSGLWLRDTNSIHTFFVFFPIDVVFLDSEMKVLRTVEDMRPFRVSPIVWKAKSVLELPTETIRSKGIKIDDQIKLL